MRTISSRVLLTAMFVAAGASLCAGPANDFKNEIRPILEKHCYECHGPEKQKAKLNLASFTDYEKVLEAKDVWQVVLERIQAYEMPPEGKPELGFNKQQKMM